MDVNPGSSLNGPRMADSVRYRVVHATQYFYTESVPLCHNELHLTPRDGSRQICLEHELAIEPAPQKLDEYVDYFGNSRHFFSIQEHHQQLAVVAKSEVEVSQASYIPPHLTPAWDEVRASMEMPRDRPGQDAKQFVFDSPHVAYSPAVAEFARESFAPARPWLEAVLDLTWRIHRDFAYDPTATSVSTPLDTVLAMRRGVCQDFSHLQIGCLRAMGLPARYISGYMLTARPDGQPRLIGADASHAWLSAYCPGLGWIEFDPTNNTVPSLEHVVVAWGRDYSDVCPIKGVVVGGGQHSMQVSVDVRPLDEPQT